MPPASSIMAVDGFLSKNEFHIFLSTIVQLNQECSHVMDGAESKCFSTLTKTATEQDRTNE